MPEVEQWVEFPNDEFIRGERLANSRMPPMHKGKRRHITGESFILHDHLKIYEIQAELQRLSGEQMEIIYDRATTTDCILPGHHIYRVLRRGGAPSEDVMVLEFSCKKDMEKPWSLENARMPDWWIVKWFKQRDRARMTREEETEVDRAVETKLEKLKKEKDAKMDAASQEWAGAVDTFAKKGRVGKVFDGVKGGA